MTEKELQALVQRGEDQRTKFKVAEADSADIARAIVAMANSSGGLVLMGVGDDGELLGLWYAQPTDITRHMRTMPDLASWRQWVVNVSRHNCEPAVPVSPEHVTTEGRAPGSATEPTGKGLPRKARKPAMLPKFEGAPECRPASPALSRGRPPSPSALTRSSWGT